MANRFQSSRKRLLMACLLGLLLGVGGAVLWHLGESPDAPITVSHPLVVAESIAPADDAIEVEVIRSLAVLPFTNLSPKDSAWFGVGLHDQILARLAKIGPLKVIARESTLRTASAPGNLQEIARLLGVTYVVTGSVERVGDSVRINLQLSEASTARQLWAESYERKVVDSLRIENEVTAAIAQALGVTLSDAQQRQLRSKPTTSIAAYDAFLRGLSHERSGDSPEHQQRAATQYLKATQLDPQFVEAWMHLVFTESQMYVTSVKKPAATLLAMERAVETVTRLRPDSVEAWSALGYLRGRVLEDHPAAATAFERVLQQAPHQATLLGALAAVERRLGRMRAAIEHASKAEQLDPLNSASPVIVGDLLAAVRRYPEARSAFDRSLNLAPDAIDILARKAATYQAQGDLPAAELLLENIPPPGPADGLLVDVRYRQFLYEGRYSEALALIDTVFGKAAVAKTANSWVRLIFHLDVATLRRLMGHVGTAKLEFQLALQLAGELRAAGADPLRLTSVLGLIHAGLGDKDSAIREAQRNLAAKALDAATEQDATIQLAKIHAYFGDEAAALALLTSSLQAPYGITTAALRLDPAWEPLRRNPRFQELTADGD